MNKGKGFHVHFRDVWIFKTPHVYSLLVGPTTVKTHQKIGKKKTSSFGDPRGGSTGAKASHCISSFGGKFSTNLKRTEKIGW